MALDLTTNVNPGTPTDQYRETMLLKSRHWQILAADDGILILHRVAELLPTVPNPPPRYITFAVKPDQPLEPIGSFGDDLDLLRRAIYRREQVNLRVPDVILLASWRVRQPLPARHVLSEIMTNTHGRVANHFDDRLTTAWLPMDTLEAGPDVVTRSVQIGVVNIWSGVVSFRLRYNRSIKVDNVINLRQD